MVGTAQNGATAPRCCCDVSGGVVSIAARCQDDLAAVGEVGSSRDRDSVVSQC